MAAEVGATSEATAFKVSLTKQHTVAKLVERFWDGRLSAEEIARRLPEDFWEAIRGAASRESMQRAAKTLTNKFKQGLRQEKREGRQQQRSSREHTVLQKYGLLALPVRELGVQDHAEIDWSRAPRPVVPELNSLPPRRYFATRQWDLLMRELRQLRERRAQIEYVAAEVLRRVSASAQSARPVKHIVDFGGGRGDFALALAWILQQEGICDLSVTVVELDEAYCRQGRQRAAGLVAASFPGAAVVANGSGSAARATMPVLKFLSVPLEKFDDAFDLAVGLDTCGPLTDIALQKCLDRGAEFVLLTCGFGKIPKQASSHDIEYPCAGGTLVRGREDFFELCRIAEGVAGKVADKESTQAMRIINSDRCCLVRQRGGWAALSMMPRSITSKNMLIVGTATAACAGPLDIASPLASKSTGASGAAPASAATALRGVPLDVGPPAQAPGTLRVVVVADTHCRHHGLSMPSGDLLIVCGDFTKSGTPEEVEDFGVWLDGLPFREKVVVAGNHEITFDPTYYHDRGRRFHKAPEGVPDVEGIKRTISARPGVRYLEDAAVHLDFGAGCIVRVFGSPCQGPYFDGHSMAAFTLSKQTEADVTSAEDPWEAFTSRTCGVGSSGGPSEPIDILVTHGPPFGICDLSTEQSEDGRPSHAGSRALLEVVRRVRPLLHAFGHIHEGYGVQTDGVTFFANAAICSERYVAQRLPIVVDLPKAAATEGGAGDRGLARPRRDEGLAFWRARPATVSTYGAEGRPRHGGVVSPLYRRLMETLHSLPELQVHTAGCNGYRNKASFSLGPLFAEQDSCAPRLNALASHLQAGVRASANPGLWVEAAIKLSRRDTLGLKLVLRGERAAEAWIKAESTAWWERLQAAVPGVTSVTYQVAPGESDEKPPKSPWHPRYPMPTALFGQPFIIEETPCSGPGAPGLPFRLSPDAFSEVNHAAEDAMFQTLCEWVSELRERGEASVLGMFGRNCGFLGLALQDAFNFDVCYAYTHCPVTLADVEASVALNPSMQSRWITGKSEKYNFGATLATIPEGKGPMLVHVTNSRHGLPDGIIPALKARSDIFAVAYNSCSHLPLPSEWQDLCTGPAAFELRKFKSFDLLAGTEFQSAYFLLVRRPPTLLLPIGPPGVGKSWLARQLSAACCVFERDRAFFEERMREDVTFAVAKQRTHHRLLAALRASTQEHLALLLDSTNGLRDARLAYCQRAQASRLVYLVLRPSSEEFVLERVRQREGDASTPEHERIVGLGGLRPDASDAEVRAKLAKVFAAIEYPDASERPGGTAPIIIHVAPEDAAAMEHALWRCFLLLVCPMLDDMGAPEVAA